MKPKNPTFTVFKNDLPKIRFYNVLVVDDYGPAKMFLGENLRKLPRIGDIDFADSGEDALKKVGSQQYDLIFLDVMMPGLDGFETCERIREIKGYELAPIIMVTGDTSTDIYSKWASSAFTSYITKPIQQEPFIKLNLEVFSILEGNHQLD